MGTTHFMFIRGVTHMLHSRRFCQKHYSEKMNVFYANTMQKLLFFVVNKDNLIKIIQQAIFLHYGLC